MTEYLINYYLPDLRGDLDEIVYLVRASASTGDDYRNADASIAFLEDAQNIARHIATSIGEVINGIERY